MKVKILYLSRCGLSDLLWKAYLLRKVEGMSWDDIVEEVNFPSHKERLCYHLKCYCKENGLKYPIKRGTSTYEYRLHQYGMSFKEIARLLGVPKATVRSRYYRAVKEFNLPLKPSLGELSYELRCNGWSYQKIADLYFKGICANAHRSVKNYADKNGLDIPC